VPAAGGVQLVVNVADDTPDTVEIDACPDTPATNDAAEHDESENNAKSTDPVGGVNVVPANVAVSDKVAIATPETPDDGDACVVNVGDATATATTSSEAPQASAKPLLLASPAYDANQ
jgi:hypothetical protein